MLGGVISYRAYFGVAIVIAIITYLIAHFGGASLVGFFSEIRGNALAYGISEPIVTLFVGPFIYVFSNPLPGAAIAGIFWPLIIVWLVLLFMIIILTAFAQGYNTAATGTDQFN